jgi:hypothetical protein
VVGTVSPRPFPGLPVEVVMAHGTRALPGVAAAWGAAGEDLGREARWFW